MWNYVIFTVYPFALLTSKLRVNLILNHSNFISSRGWDVCFSSFPLSYILLSMQYYILEGGRMWVISFHSQTLNHCHPRLCSVNNFNSRLVYWSRLRFYYCPKYVTGKCNDLCSVFPAVLLFNFVSSIPSFWKPLNTTLDFLNCSLFLCLFWCLLTGYKSWGCEASAFPPLVCLLSSISSNLCVGNSSFFIQALFLYLSPHT